MRALVSKEALVGENNFAQKVHRDLTTITEFHAKHSSNSVSGFTKLLTSAMCTPISYSSLDNFFIDSASSKSFASKVRWERGRIH